MFLDVKSYIEKKEKGLSFVLVVDNEKFMVATKFFSEEDGSELPPITNSVTISEVEDEIKKKLSEITELEVLKKDLIALQVK